MLLYDRLAAWWPLLSPPSEYEEDAELFHRILAEACDSPPETLLELGSGGGSGAYHLKKHFRSVTLADLSPDMLDVSRAINPECEHVQGDMRTLRLGRRFDCVFVHDAVCYMTTEQDLARAVETAAAHCRPGGAVLFAPDHTRETFEPGIESGGHDAGGRGLRFLEWTWDPAPDDSTYQVDYAFILREEDGSTRVEHDRHVEGLFSRETWLRLLGEAGCEASAVPFEYSGVDRRMELFLGRVG